MSQRSKLSAIHDNPDADDGRFSDRGRGEPGSVIPASTAAVSSPPSIALDKRGGDAWTWEKRLTGTCGGCPPATTIALQVGEWTTLAAREGDTFSATVRLNPGPNSVVAVATLADGREATSPAVVYDVRLQPRPTARLAADIGGDRVRFDATSSEPSDFDGAPLRSWRVAPESDNPANLNLRETSPGVFAAPIPEADGMYAVTVTVEDEAGRCDRATTAVVVEGGVPRLPDPVHERAPWIATTVVYGVVPRNFDPPGFSGVAARLDDLGDLGVTALWFSPITRTLPDHFGYEVVDYFETNPTYGTREEFKRLVDAAHARGLRVLMDVVPNHTSDEHPYARDAAAFGEASTYWDFYDRDSGGTPTHYFNWVHLPNLNFANPEVRRFMLEAMTYWVREIGVDGFRVDAVWGIKERQPTWLTDFLVEINRIKPDSLIIAEASARDPFYVAQGFDAAYDWTAELGHWAWGKTFGGIAPIGAAMGEALTDNGAGYPPDGLVMRFLNNNDTGARFISTYGLGFYKTALAMLLTLPGLPCLFTGDEVGAEFQPYEDTGPIDWRDPADLRPYVKTLIALRQGTAALHARSWLPLPVAPAMPLFGFLRFDATQPTTAPVIVLLNFSDSDRDAVVTLPQQAGLAGGATVTDLLTHQTATTAPDGETLALSIPAWGVRVVTNDPA